MRAIEAVDMADAQDRPHRRLLQGHAAAHQGRRRARARPAILLLDEPFNGTDPRQRLHMMDLLQDMARDGATIVFSSHILEEVEQVADTIHVIVAGRLQHPATSTRSVG